MKSNTEEQWKIFKDVYEDYATATELGKKDAKIQAATLKMLVGRECKKTLKILKLSTAKMQDPKEIIQALDDNFVVNHNVLYEHNKFYKAKQQQHETVEQFLDRLRHLALDM